MIHFVHLGLKTLSPLYIIAFGRLIAGCNDSSILDVELQIPDKDQQLELTPPNANPEPPELVERYRELWMEIVSKYGKSLEIDSVADVEANRLAIELAQYDGPMAQVFEFIKAGLEIAADSEGQSIEEIKEELSQRVGNSSFSGANCPDCKSLSDCTSRCEETRHQDDT
ncbi:MAG: hypothetical protein OXF06_04680 [Bacteroidetes bacterium]|nr:hypothetical protein [Bacteroidota bacterium]MCY4224111.1 hypothetical protein [Bacteroidota bacterium]